MKALLVISAALASLTHVASAAPTSVQLNSIAFTAGCTSVGCGGEFKGMIGGNAVGGQLKNGTTVELFCIDYQNDVFIPGAIYQANLSTITTGSDLSNTRYGRTTSKYNSSSDPDLPIVFSSTQFATTTSTLAPTQVQRYQMTAWLTQQYATANASTRNAIQSAIWQITDVKVPVGEVGAPIPIVSGSAAWLTSAATFVSTNSNSGYYSEFRIVTNTSPVYLYGQNPAQEFMTIVTPEPKELILFGTAMVILLAVRKRVLRRREATLV